MIDVRVYWISKAGYLFSRVVEVPELLEHETLRRWLTENVSQTSVVHARWKMPSGSTTVDTFRQDPAGAWYNCHRVIDEEA